MDINKLAKAKAALILDHPFFASLLLSMPMVEKKDIKTLATNGDEILYNPDFIESLNQSEILFVLAHEVMHCVLQHMHRRNNRDANKWNIAADYVINETLVNEKIGAMPEGCLLNPSIVSQGEGTTEGVYNILPDRPPQNQNQSNGQGNGQPQPQQNQSGGYPQPGESGGALDEVLDAGKDEAENSQKEAEMRVKIVQAANAAKMMGKLSAGLERTIKTMTATRSDWRAILRRFLSERAKDYYSYAKPKRRFLADDINLPSLVGESMGNIVVAVDCSGSIDDKTLEAFSAEIKAIIEDTAPALTHVIYFDSEVLRQESFSRDDSFNIKACGGGGTAFSPVFKHINDNELNPVACVVLTDLWCDDFGNCPEYPVLWATTDNDKAPFGEVLSIED